MMQFTDTPDFGVAQLDVWVLTEENKKQMISKFTVCDIKLPFTLGAVLKLTSLIHDMKD
jgi:hypothetical protein